MARYRTIKPELFADEKLAEVSIPARFLFVGLLPFCDDMGRRSYFPRRIKLEVFPADDEITVAKVEELLQELADIGVIEFYDVGPRSYLRIPHFLQHQLVRKPSHTDTPLSPSEIALAESEGKIPVICNCAKPECELQRANGNGTFLQEHPHQRRTSAVPVQHSYRPSAALVKHLSTTSGAVGSVGSVSSKPLDGGIRDSGKSVLRDTHTRETSENPDNTPSQAQHSNPQITDQALTENRRAQRRALDEISLRMLDLLKIPASGMILKTLADSIATLARCKACTFEASAQEIGARAALIGSEAEPEDWLGWFYDQRFQYFAQDDKRLLDREIEGRAVCGGPRCSEGWERVRIGDKQVSRRCPDCARLWQE